MANKADKILFICHDVLGRKISGVGIRYLNLAQETACAGYQVTLTSPIMEDNFQLKGIKLVSCKTAVNQEKEILQSDIIVASILSLRLIKSALTNHKILIFDLYDPIIFEQQERLKNTPLLTRKIKLAQIASQLQLMLASGDYFLCASHIQRDWWQMYLDKMGRGQNLISVVPFGLQKNIKDNKQNIYHKIKGIGKNDKIILWGGGIYDWLDPITPIKAMAEVIKQRKDAKLIFLSSTHPNPALPKMDMIEKAITFAKKLQLYNRFVYFLPGWIAYEERDNYFQNAYLGICAHFDNLETKYAFRTRDLDYLKAELPIVTTKGDYFANLVEAEKIGLSVDFEKARAMATAILKLLQDKKFYNSCQKNIVKIKSRFYWPNVAKPLLEFCRYPKRAQDKKRPFWLAAKYYFYKILVKI